MSWFSFVIIKQAFLFVFVLFFSSSEGKFKNKQLLYVVSVIKLGLQEYVILGIRLLKCQFWDVYFFFYEYDLHEFTISLLFCSHISKQYSNPPKTYRFALSASLLLTICLSYSLSISLILYVPLSLSIALMGVWMGTMVCHTPTFLYNHSVFTFSQPFSFL